MADVQIDTTARIERVRYNTQTGGFAGDPASGYAWHWVNGTGSYSGVFVENDQGDIYGPFVDYNEGARVYNDANLPIANETEVDLAFNSEVYDTNNIHSLATGTNSRLTCNVAGKYLIIGHFWFESQVAEIGFRNAYIKVNDSIYLCQQILPVRANPTSVSMELSTIAHLNVGDYVNLSVYQDSGGELDVRYIADRTPYFMMQKIG